VWLRAQSIEVGEAQLERSLEMRYQAQVHEVTIPVPGGALDEAAAEQIVADLRRKYDDLYGEGAGFPGAQIEVESMRVTATGAMHKPPVTSTPAEATTPEPTQHRDVYWSEAGAAVATPIFRGEDLPTGAHIEGPAIVELPMTSVVIGHGQSADLDEFGNVAVTL